MVIKYPYIFSKPGICKRAKEVNFRIKKISVNAIIKHRNPPTSKKNNFKYLSSAFIIYKQQDNNIVAFLTKYVKIDLVNELLPEC